MNRSTQYRTWIRGILGRAAGAALALAILLFTVPGQAQQTPQVLHNHVRPVVASGQAVPVGHLPLTQRLQLAIMLPLRNQAELTDLLDRLYDPTSSDYRQFLSVAQFTEGFGPTEQDYQAVVDFAKANGFTVTDTPANRLLVDVNGSVAQIEKAFHVVMVVYRHPTEDRTFYSPDREPSLDLSVPVSHIAGLDNFSIPRPRLRRAPAGKAIRSNLTGSGPGGQYLAGDMRAAYYGGTALTGSGQSVGLMEYDGYDMSDVTGTEDGVSYSVPINNVLIDGASADSDGDDGEQVLDIVQAIGMAPGLSQVLVYIAPMDDDLGDVNIFNQMAVDNIAKQLSNSWGWDPDDPSSDDPIFEEFAAQGQNLFVASGDDGVLTGDNSTDYEYPADDAYIVSVGGTDLTTTGPGGSWKSETAWSCKSVSNCNNVGGSGGGPSDSPQDTPIPSWQSGVPNSSNEASTTLRNVPDVAMEANTNNYNCDEGDCGGGSGGTSYAAPTWAGFLALVNQQAVAHGYSSVGFINPAIYSIGEGSNYNSDFHDITSGENGPNGKYNAVTGYDDVTGWGSPNGQNLINALVGAGLLAQSITFTQNAPASAAYNSSFTVAASASSGLAVTYTSSGSCSNVGATYTMTSGSGTCSVIANQAGNSIYAAATVTQSVTAMTVSPPPLMCTANPPGNVPYNSTFTVTCTGGNGSPLSFATSGVCSRVGAAKFVMTSGFGVCMVTVNQAGNSNYSAAPPFTLSVNATQASQSITFTQNAPASATYNSNFTVAATGGASGNAVTFTSAGSCSNSGATYTMTSSTGTCSVMANQAGNGNYAAATQVTQTVSATPAPQTITFSTSAPATAVYNSNFTVAATGGASGNAVTFTSGGSCSNCGRDLYHDERHGNMLGDRQPGGQQQLLGCTYGHTNRERGSGESDHHVQYKRTGDGGIQQQLHRDGHGWRKRQRRDLYEWRVVQQYGRDLHHDERHGNVLGDRKPGGQRQLRGGHAGHTERDCDSGDAEHHVHPERTGQRSL